MNTPVKLASMSLIAMLVILGNSTSYALKPGDGYVDVPGGKVWYRVVGTAVDKTPIILLHGGPGAPSYYLKPLAALADQRPVVFYDQLGCGRSPHEADTTLWTIDRFVAELESLRQALGIRGMYLYGHSWGTILAVEYYFKHPSNVRGLILAGPALSIPRWTQDAHTLLSTLPDSIQAMVAKNERTMTFEDPGYQSAVMMYYQRYLARRQPWSADIDSCFAQIGVSEYTYMCGPSEFTLTGTLKNYDCTSRLGGIRVPTLFTAGKYDEAIPKTVQYFQSLVRGSDLKILENSAHLSMQDEPERSVQIVRDFLKKIETK